MHLIKQLIVYVPTTFSHRLCSDLQTLIAERAEIEKAYAKNLRLWSKKWGELIEKGIRMEQFEVQCCVKRT